MARIIKRDKYKARYGRPVAARRRPSLRARPAGLGVACPMSPAAWGRPAPRFSAPGGPAWRWAEGLAPHFLYWHLQGRRKRILNCESAINKCGIVVCQRVRGDRKGAPKRSTGRPADRLRADRYRGRQAEPGGRTAARLAFAKACGTPNLFSSCYFS